MASICQAQEQLEMRKKVGDVLAPAKEEPKKEFKRIKELGGEVVIDGSLRVLESNNGKIWDLVEISTPVTPASNHARIFLRADGINSTLVIIYDDGTSETIATNQF